MLESEFDGGNGFRQWKGWVVVTDDIIGIDIGPLLSVVGPDWLDDCMGHSSVA
jgi:hypothetical protein